MLVVVLFVNLRSLRTSATPHDVLLPTSYYTESKKSLLVMARREETSTETLPFRRDTIPAIGMKVERLVNLLAVLL